MHLANNGRELLCGPSASDCY